MAQPVWVLSVDLQTKTATFQSGMADAAKSARGAFNDIKSSASDMGDGVSKGTTNVRAALGLLDNTIRGAHGAAMADLIREFSDTKVVMAALPFLPVAGGLLFLAGTVVEIINAVREWREEQKKLGDDQTKFGTTINETFNGLDQKLLQAEQRSDELRNDHLGALQKKLQLIDAQSMAELVKSLETVAKAADIVFADLKSHWYTLGVGADGASHALEQFQIKYASLISQGKDKEASDLLGGTLKSAKEVLTLQQQISAYYKSGQSGHPDDATDAAINRLRSMTGRTTATDKEVQAQQALVEALNAQLGIEQKVSQIKGVEKGNAGRSTAGEMSRENAEAARQSADSQLRLAEMAIAADRSTAQARLAITHASIEDRLNAETEFAQRERDTQLAANQAQIAALDKLGKEYPNQFKALHDKALEIQQQYQTQVAQLTSAAQTEQAARELQDMETLEREKINATQTGSAERLAAIDAAIAEEADANLQATETFRGLLQQRVETVREMAQQEAEQQAEAGRLAAENEQKMGELRLAAQREADALSNSARRLTDQMVLQQEMEQANALYSLQMTSLSQQISALDKYGKDYENKLRALQDKQKQLTQQHENEITAIKAKAEEARNHRILDSERQFEDSIARGLASVLTGHQSFAAMMNQIGSQVAEGMIQNALKSMMADDMTKEKDAAAAARKMFNAGAQFPFPANIVMAPALGAAAFAATMAFQSGTDGVPGVGRGDIIPALLEPGEGVVPGGVMDNLRKMSSSGSFGNTGPHITMHYRPTFHVNAIDHTGVRGMLDKHTTDFERHFHKVVRGLNR
jgi:hypothetical protein